MTQRNEAALNTVVETHLLPNGYIALDRNGFDRQRVNFPETVLACICATQPKEWVNQDTQHTGVDHPILMLKPAEIPYTTAPKRLCPSNEAV